MISHIFIDITLVTLYFKVFLLQCNYTCMYWVILINYIYLLYKLGLGFGLGILTCNCAFIVIIIVSTCNMLQGHLKIKCYQNFLLIMLIHLMIAILKKVLIQELNPQDWLLVLYVEVLKLHLIKNIMSLCLLWVELREKHQSCSMCVSVSALDLCRWCDVSHKPQCWECA